MNKLLFSTGLGFFLLESLALIGYLVSKLNVSPDVIQNLIIFGGIGFINLIFGTLLIIGATKN